MTFIFCSLLQAQSLKDLNFEYKIRKASPELKDAPLLVMLHGYGSNEDDLFDLASTLDPRFTVISLRAPMALNFGGYGWYHLERKPDKTLLFDYKEAADSRNKVMRFIRTCCRELKLDSNRVFLLGFSQGTMMSYDIALSYPGRIAGVCALSGRLVEESKQQCKNIKALQTTAFFIAHGTEDEIIPFKEAGLARDFLKSKGVISIEYNTYTMQHVLNGQEIIALRDWLKRQLDRSKPSVNKR
ncbi:MAG TPA: phospholipase [Bacteroidia bacterium]|nr:phospholipase [Bacteroidia bacterium]